jgi:hypothetical protein
LGWAAAMGEDWVLVLVPGMGQVLEKATDLEGAMQAQELEVYCNFQN